ncbi:glycosyltransferase family 2 protein [Bradyrhizobium sp. USDA 329]|uniref:glycosyltransferase family 2 protein n=1 Tax=Bradyrhizobium sp. USDA 329 TaxID=3156310 RepID=UPI003517C24F
MRKLTSPIAGGLFPGEFLLPIERFHEVLMSNDQRCWPSLCEGKLNIDVILATRGRPADVQVLLDQLRLQERAPDNVVLVGAEPEDLPKDLPGAAAVPNDPSVHRLVSPRPGLTSQRNHGVQTAKRISTPEAWLAKIIVFFDDDFRPAADWLQKCEALFAASPQVLAVTGAVIMDGARGSIAITEEQASDALALPRASDQIGHSKWKEGLYRMQYGLQGDSLRPMCIRRESSALWLAGGYGFFRTDQGILGHLSSFKLDRCASRVEVWTGQWLQIWLLAAR